MTRKQKKGALQMDDEPKQRSPRRAKQKAIEKLHSSIVNPGTKKRRASTHEPSDRAQKTRKAATPPHVDGRAENVGPSYQRAPGSQRMASHASLTERETIVYASGMEAQITAEARGVTRKNIPWDTFHSTYLRDFSIKAQPKLTVESVKKLGQGNWEEKAFEARLSQTFSDKVLRDLKLSSSGTKTLSDANKGKEVPSKPDFVLYAGGKSPTWANVELLFEHTRGQEGVVKEFTQWLRGAWSVFHHQPFRRHLYGILFIQPNAYVCYADHGCAVYSEALNFVKNNQHTQFLADFLTGFIANPEGRGRDPTVTVDETNKARIRHAGTTWVELPKGPLCYRPSLIGRHIRVAQVQDLEAKISKKKMVMKSTWEEKLPPASSPPSEVEVLKILVEANVRGLPQPYALDSAIVRDGGSEIETRSFPENCEVALSASTQLMAKMEASYVSNHVAKPLAPGANVGDRLLRRAKVLTQRQQFNEPLEVRRRLTRVLMSYCVPLKEAMRHSGPELLMQTIRDAMIVYYEAYQLPNSGFIHGDISIENILVPLPGCVLTGGLTYKDRKGTLIDWNLCFNAHGESSNRTFKSGTPAFMAPILLDDEKIPRRTLGHDMESFFAVIIWIATLPYDDEATFQAKPLANILLDQKTAPKHIVNAKDSWFKNPEKFRKRIIDHFEDPYRDDKKFLKCLNELRKILYPVPVDDLNLDDDLEEMEDADPMKEDLFRQCMKEIDDYLDEIKGCEEMQWIDSNALAQHTPESVIGGRPERTG